MKKIIVAVLLTSVLMVSLAAPVLAANGQPPQGSCPPGFETHMMGGHGDHDHHDHHIGLKVDLNGDGLICVKHLKNGLHVHVDNVIP